MPPLPSIANTMKMTLRWNLQGDANAQTVLHWQYSGGTPTATDLSSFGNSFVTSTAQHLKALCSGNTTLESVTCLDIASTTGAQGVSDTTWTGTRSGNLVPNSVGALVNWQIAQRYRGGKPRTTLPVGVNSDLLSSVSWTSTFVTAVNTAVSDDFIGFLSTGAGSITITQLGTVSYYSGYNPPVTLPSGRVKQSPKLRTGGPVWYEYQGGLCNPRFGMMRRRVPGS